MLIKKVIYKVFKEPRLILKFFLEIKTNGLKQSLDKTRNITSNSFIQSDSKDDFFNYYFDEIDKKSLEYKTYIKHDLINEKLKLIAFYLPQFHPFEENDNFWGKGFTEWTNVSKAIPQFKGHYQPKLPGELGFYDLRLEEVQKQQIELAKNYGLSGFCYYYYWFGGKKIMNQPIENLLNNKDLDFPFCISWANENWTRRWDGDDSDVLLGQDHSPEDDIDFIKEISRYMKDDRYIKINNKPVLIVYRPSLFPDIKKTVSRWREWCKGNNIGEIYIVTTHQVFDSINPLDIGFDAAIEFAPMTQLREGQVEGVQDITLFNNDFQGMVLNYDTLLSHVTKYKSQDYTKFRGITPSWDNEARKTGKGVIFHNSVPSKYKKWLEYLVEYTKSEQKENEQFIFINAWNEWAEGAMLEPDRKYGYAYLEATYQVMKGYDKPMPNIEENREHDIAIVIHLYYIETWEFFKKQLKNLEFDFDLYITTTFEKLDSVKKLVTTDYPNSKVLSFSNRGRDILPFLKLYKNIKSMEYKYLCKLHSKQSTHLNDGKNWGEMTISNLLENSGDIFTMFENDSNLGVVAPVGAIVANKDFIASNIEGLRKVERMLKIDNILNTDFVAGSMMWMRPIALNGIEELFKEYEFEIEDGQVDGTIAHTIERVISCVARKNNFLTQEVIVDSDSVLPDFYQAQITSK